MDEYQTTPDTWQDSCGRLGRGNNTTGRLSNIWSAVPVAYCFLSLFGKNLVNGPAAPEGLMTNDYTQGNFAMGSPTKFEA